MDLSSVPILLNINKKWNCWLKQNKIKHTNFSHPYRCDDLRFCNCTITRTELFFFLNIMYFIINCLHQGCRICVRAWKENSWKGNLLQTFSFLKE